MKDYEVQVKALQERVDHLTKENFRLNDELSKKTKEMERITEEYKKVATDYFILKGKVDAYERVHPLQSEIK